MSFIRARQRPVTAILPHNGNRRVIVPKRGKGPPPGRPFVDPTVWRPIADQNPTRISAGWGPLTAQSWRFVMPPGDAFNPLGFAQLQLGQEYRSVVFADGNLTPTFRWRKTGDPPGDTTLDTRQWYDDTFTVAANDGGGNIPRFTHTANESGEVQLIFLVIYERIQPVYVEFGTFTHKPSELTFWLRHPQGAATQANAWEIGFNIDKPPEPDIWVNLAEFIDAATNGQKQSVRFHARANGWPG